MIIARRRNTTSKSKYRVLSASTVIYEEASSAQREIASAPQLALKGVIHDISALVKPGIAVETWMFPLAMAAALAPRKSGVIRLPMLNTRPQTELTCSIERKWV